MGWDGMGLVGWGLGGMEENKKSGGGDVRAKALSWDIEPPEKKAASRRKSRLRRKKTAAVGVAWVWALRGGL